MDSDNQNNTNTGKIEVNLSQILNNPSTTRPSRSIKKKVIIFLFGFLIILAVILSLSYFYFAKSFITNTPLIYNNSQKTNTKTNMANEIPSLSGKGFIYYAKILKVIEEGGLTNAVLVKIDLSTGKLNNLFSFQIDQGNLNSNLVAISPDGKRFAYHKEKVGLDIVNLENKQEDIIKKDILPDANGVNNTRYYPISWSPNGKKLLISAAGFEGGNTAVIDYNGQNYIVAKDLSGTNLGCGGVNWSPDSSSFLIFAQGYGYPCGNSSGLYLNLITTPSGQLIAKPVYTLKTGKEGTQMNASVDEAVWSLDGQKILFTRDIIPDDKTPLEGMYTNASTINSDGSQLNNLSDISTQNTNLTPQSFLWLDNNKFFFVYDAKLYIYNLETNTKLLLSSDNYQPVIASYDKKYLIIKKPLKYYIFRLEDKKIYPLDNVIISNLIWTQ